MDTPRPPRPGGGATRGVPHAAQRVDAQWVAWRSEAEGPLRGAEAAQQPTAWGLKAKALRSRVLRMCITHVRRMTARMDQRNQDGRIGRIYVEHQPLTL